MSSASADSSAEVAPGSLPVKKGSRARRFGRFVLEAMTFGYVAALLILIAALEWWGERNWLLSLFLFAPPQLLLAPLLVLSPLCLLFHRRLLLLHLLCAAMVGFGFMTFRWAIVPGFSDTDFTAVTLNAGASHRQQFLSFVRAEKPDVILLQDAFADGTDPSKALPEMYASVLGEFCLLSKHPITHAELLPQPLSPHRYILSRFEVKVRGQPLVLYNVHMPTPRRELDRFLSRRMVRHLLREEARASVSVGHEQWTKERLELARAIAQVFAQETRPFIVAGDFNMPDHGYTYHLFAKTLTDAFAVSGRGWGLTFPGRVEPDAPKEVLAAAKKSWSLSDRFHAVLGVFGPWLRLDYLFAGRGWEPVECRAEAGRKSEHRAVLARFRPVDDRKK